MFKLYLENKPHKDVLIKNCASVDEVNKEINHWLNMRSYHSHYWRTWVAGNKHYIDFGDWHVFFYYVEG